MIERPIVRRRRDGAFFQPGTPPGYTEADAFADCLQAGVGGGVGFHFYRVELVRRTFLGIPLGYRWRRTGEAWAFRAAPGQIPEADSFDVLTDRQARDLARGRLRLVDGIFC